MKGFATRMASQSALPSAVSGGQGLMSVMGSKYGFQSFLGAIWETFLKHHYLLCFCDIGHTLWVIWGAPECPKAHHELPIFTHGSTMVPK